MNKHEFITSLARTTAATLAVAQVDPAALASKVTPPPLRQECPKATMTAFDQVGSTDGRSVMISLRLPNQQWTKDQEKEFRRLALAEATESISAEDKLLLSQMDQLRQTMLNPRSAEEMERELKRDGLLQRMEQNFQDYIALKDGSYFKRRSAS